MAGHQQGCLLNKEIERGECYNSRMNALQKIKFIFILLVLAACTPPPDQQVIPTNTQPVQDTPAPQGMPASLSFAVTPPYVQPEDAVWPGDSWPEIPPLDAGMDAAKLQALVEAVPKRAPSLSSVMVTRSGQVVLEEYFGSTGEENGRQIYSITKSVIATLVGIALDQGLISSVDARVSEFFPEREFDSPEWQSMTLEQVLMMSTGLKWTEDDLGSMHQSPEWTDFMLDLPVVETPGARFNYCTGCSHLLSAILSKATGMDAHEFARQYLFDPIGIRGEQWQEASEGLPIGGWGLRLTTRDLARLGYLYLRGGVWEGRQVVSSDWVQAAAATPHIAVGDNPKLLYGYQWWQRPSINGYAALGRAGQMIAVIPEHELVVVFTASGTDHDSEFALIEEYILPAIQP